VLVEAEEGRGDWSVTGVQRCALPIYDGGLGDQRMLGERRLDLERADAMALHLDQVGGEAAEDREAPAGVAPHQVARPVPAIDENARRRLLVLEVAAEERRSAHEELALGRVLAARRRDLRLDARQRHADRAGRPRPVDLLREGDPDLGRAVAL